MQEENLGTEAELVGQVARVEPMEQKSTRAEQAELKSTRVEQMTTADQTGAEDPHSGAEDHQSREEEHHDGVGEVEDHQSEAEDHHGGICVLGQVVDARES